MCLILVPSYSHVLKPNYTEFILLVTGVIRIEDFSMAEPKAQNIGEES